MSPNLVINTLEIILSEDMINIVNNELGDWDIYMKLDIIITGGNYMSDLAWKILKINIRIFPSNNNTILAIVLIDGNHMSHLTFTVIKLNINRVLLK